MPVTSPLRSARRGSDVANQPPCFDSGFRLQEPLSTLVRLTRVDHEAPGRAWSTREGKGNSVVYRPHAISFPRDRWRGMPSRSCRNREAPPGGPLERNEVHSTSWVPKRRKAMSDVRSDRRTSWRRTALSVAALGVVLAGINYVVAGLAPVASVTRTDDDQKGARPPSVSRPGCCVPVALPDGGFDEVCQSMSFTACRTAGGTPTIGCGNGGRAGACRSRVTSEEPVVSDPAETVIE
jgi:hypothetical protein